VKRRTSWRHSGYSYSIGGLYNRRMNHFLFVIVTLALFLTSAFLVLADAEVELELDRVVRDAEAVPADIPVVTPKTVTPPAQVKFSSLKDFKKTYNIADDVSEDYPVIFNIILFISISLILALIAICVTIATMDPGRDSLIYRVTSAQRYKKDN